MVTSSTENHAPGEACFSLPPTPPPQPEDPSSSETSGLKVSSLLSQLSSSLHMVDQDRQEYMFLSLYRKGHLNAFPRNPGFQLS